MQGKQLRYVYVYVFSISEFTAIVWKCFDNTGVKHRHGQTRCYGVKESYTFCVNLQTAKKSMTMFCQMRKLFLTKYNRVQRKYGWLNSVIHIC